MPDIWDDSVNADAFKSSLYRSFDLIKENCMDGNILRSAGMKQQI